MLWRSARPWVERAAERDLDPGRRAGLEVACEASGNGKRAKAAVTRYGC